MTQKKMGNRGRTSPPVPGGTTGVLPMLARKLTSRPINPSTSMVKPRKYWANGYLAQLSCSSLICRISSRGMADNTLSPASSLMPDPEISTFEPLEVFGELPFIKASSRSSTGNAVFHSQPEPDLMVTNNHYGAKK